MSPLCHEQPVTNIKYMSGCTLPADVEIHAMIVSDANTRTGIEVHLDLGGGIALHIG